MVFFSKPKTIEGTLLHTMRCSARGQYFAVVSAVKTRARKNLARYCVPLRVQRGIGGRKTSDVGSGSTIGGSN